VQRFAEGSRRRIWLVAPAGADESALSSVTDATQAPLARFAAASFWRPLCTAILRDESEGQDGAKKLSSPMAHRRLLEVGPRAVRPCSGVSWSIFVSTAARQAART